LPVRISTTAGVEGLSSQGWKPGPTSQPQPEAQPSRPAPGLQRVSVSVS
jgi:hypothetical protein